MARPVDANYNWLLEYFLNLTDIMTIGSQYNVQICQDNYNNGIKDKEKERPFGLEWDVEDIVRHQNKMLEMIMNKTDWKSK